ncbi:hypothetical protein PVAG01_02087 [Phlyctema vagabunda]|uniref:Ricin B lectin domain-containing protein n=1 Tax=Phlyctema vagabunda TaxID=108571 RepID=A0ABR4PPM0_9HELO
MSPSYSGNWYIQNVRTDTVIDLFNGNSADGTEVNGWATSLDGTNQHQIWTVADVGNGAVVIINVGTGTYISAPPGLESSSNPSPSTVARVAGRLGTPIDKYLRWRIEPQSSGSIIFVSEAYPSKILDLTASNPQNRTPVIVWSKTITDNQRWKLQPANISN